MTADLKRCTVLATPTSFGRHDPGLKERLEASVGRVIYNPKGRPLSAEELGPLLGEADGYIAGLDEISRGAIEAAPRLRVIARYGVGVDNVDLAAAAERGIVVTNTPAANSTSVAELALGLMLSLARHIPAACEAMRRGEWPRLDGVALCGKTIGLIGLGAIGKKVARRLEGFECTVLAYDPAPDLDFAARHSVQIRPLDEVLACADCISLHLPATPQTRHLVDAGFLARMKPGSYLINTARGELVDEAALYAALASGRLRGAGLDAFAAEPPGADNPLLQLPQVIATPHTGAHTDDAVRAMGEGAVADCLAVLRGEEPAYRVGPAT